PSSVGSRGVGIARPGGSSAGSNWPLASSSSDRVLSGSPKTAMPEIPIPLLPQDTEPSLDLNRVLHTLYERAGYDLAIDYTQPPQPRLRKDDQSWAAAIIAQATVPNPQAPLGGETSP